VARRAASVAPWLSPLQAPGTALTLMIPQALQRVRHHLVPAEVEREAIDAAARAIFE